MTDSTEQRCCLTCRSLWFRPDYAIRHTCRAYRVVPQRVWSAAIARPREDVGCVHWARRPPGVDPSASPYFPMVR